MKPALLLALLCTACTVDNAGYILPQGSLAGTTATVTIVPQDVLNRTAVSSGVAMKRGEVVNGLTWPMQGGCFIQLADTDSGYAALRHELWHCRGWKHD